MKRHLLLAVLLLLVPRAAHATSVQLTLTSSTTIATSGTWTLTASLSDNQSLGIASFQVDVIATGAATILKAAAVSQTLQVSDPPYSLCRSTGTLAVPNLTGISASQDTITAASNNDPTILRFGDGLLEGAPSSVYGYVAGFVLPNGPLTLATGRWTRTGEGQGTIQAFVTPGSFFNLFPLNYAVDDGNDIGNPPPPGTVQNAVAASAVIASSQISLAIPIPEPASLVLLAASGVAFVAVARRRPRRNCN